MSPGASITSIEEFRDRRQAATSGRTVIHPIPVRNELCDPDSLASLIRNPSAFFVMATRPELTEEPHASVAELVSDLRVRYRSCFWAPVIRPWVPHFQPSTRRRWERELVEHLKATLSLYTMISALHVFGPFSDRLYLIGSEPSLLRMQVVSRHLAREEGESEEENRDLPPMPYLVPMAVGRKDERSIE